MPHGSVLAWCPAGLSFSANRVPHRIRFLRIVFQNNACNRATERQHRHFEDVIRKHQRGSALEVFVTQELAAAVIGGTGAAYEKSREG